MKTALILGGVAFVASFLITSAALYVYEFAVMLHHLATWPWLR
jgi:hypothetical protein